jgi:hypothetical protein
MLREMTNPIPRRQYVMWNRFPQRIPTEVCRPARRPSTKVLRKTRIMSGPGLTITRDVTDTTTNNCSSIRDISTRALARGRMLLLIDPKQVLAYNELDGLGDGQALEAAWEDRRQSVAGSLSRRPRGIIAIHAIVGELALYCRHVATHALGPIARPCGVTGDLEPRTSGNARPMPLRAME